ncbi:MAG: SH3 domain-containing protein [Phyllobacterium sp.]
MNIRKWITGSIMLAGIFLLPGLSQAAPAYTTGSVNVRSGPGTGYSRITTLPAWYEVNIRNCRGNWCSIRASGMRGWVSANYLQGIARPRYVYPPIIVVQPPNWRPPHHGRPPHWRPPHGGKPPHWRPPGGRPPGGRPPRPQPR